MKDHFTLCLWFDNQAEEAAVFYTSVFKNSKIESISRYGKEGFEIHGQKEGTAMTVAFTINGQSFTALNGGPAFKFNEAVSIQVFCDSQEEMADPTCHIERTHERPLHIRQGNAQ